MDVSGAMDDALVGEAESLPWCAKSVRKFSASALNLPAKLFHSSFVELADAVFSHRIDCGAGSTVDGGLHATR